MKTTVRVLLLSLAILLLAQIVSGVVSVNLTRLLKNDKFTNPNQTAVNNCRASGQGSSYDTCKTFDSKDTRAACTSPSGCCESCQCGTGHPTYLAHLGKCVSLSELNWDVFGHGSNGCGPRLELKGKKGGGGDDDDRDDDDDDGHSGKHKDVCKAKSWNPPVIDFQSSSKPKIKFCHKKGVESCSLVGVQYSGVGNWRNITNFKQTFWDTKIKKDIVLQWNQAAASRLTGNIIVINLLCKQKKGKPDFPACFMFKSAGTQIVTPPPSQSTTTMTTVKLMTTTIAKSSTTKAKASSTTTTKPTTTKTTTAAKLSTATKTTTSPKTTAKPATTTKTTTTAATTTTKTKTKTKTTKRTTAAKVSTATKTTTAPTTTAKPATKTTAASTRATKPNTIVKPSTTKPTKISTTPSVPNIESTTPQKARETTSPPRAQTTSDATPTEPTEPTEPIEPTEPTEPTEPAEPTEPIEPGGAGKIPYQSRESSGAGKTATIVAVLFALLAVAAFCVMTLYYLKKWKRRKWIATINQTNVQFERQGTAQDEPGEHVYEGQNNVYQLLKRDGKPSGDNQWEPPSYQGLAKGTTEGAWVEGEVYTNPSMYQDLPKKGTNCGENLPAYLPLAKQPTRAEASIYECSYMALNGENDKTKETPNTENPYYYKVEPDNKVGETADTENPYYFKLEDHDKVKETVDKENPYYFKLEEHG